MGAPKSLAAECGDDYENALFGGGVCSRQWPLGSVAVAEEAGLRARALCAIAGALERPLNYLSLWGLNLK
jgi:hypothetical protein